MVYSKLGRRLAHPPNEPVIPSRSRSSASCESRFHEVIRRQSRLDMPCPRIPHLLDFRIWIHFFAATFILAIVAMCTNRVGQGIVLLVSSVGSIIVCVIISLALLSSAFTAALKKERARRIEHPTPRVQLYPVAPSDTPLQQLLGPAKSSLVVNINTA